jgi:hypothetical protein
MKCATFEMNHIIAGELNAQFQAFSIADQLEIFWHAILSKSTYKKLWNVVQMLLLLFMAKPQLKEGFCLTRKS